MPVSSGKSIIGIEMRMFQRIAFLLCLSMFMTLPVRAAAEMFDAQHAEPVLRSGRFVAPQLRTPRDREFRTVLKEAAKRKANFAGHHVLSVAGCGASCVIPFALDKVTGDVHWLPFTVCCADAVHEGAEPLTFRADSRLLVVTGSRNEQGQGRYLYEFKGGKFIWLRDLTDSPAAGVH
jgi:hypothetical protein